MTHALKKPKAPLRSDDKCFSRLLKKAVQWKNAQAVQSKACAHLCIGVIGAHDADFTADESMDKVSALG
jgi:hypothetical protein